MKTRGQAFQRDETMYLTTFLVAAGMAISLPDTLRTAVVVADKGLVVSKTDTLPVRPGATITEILRQSSGLYVGENGGAAGQKTVNLRGLGGAHTAIYIDGVRVGNVQSGQSDLTNLGAEQFDSAVIDYAQNSISFKTLRPSFRSGQKVSGRASLSAGSFSTWNPSARLDFKLGKATLSGTAAGLFSKGDFSYGNGLTRENNDISQFSGGLDAYGSLECGRWQAKARYNASERGTPGSTVWPSSDRQEDRNAYAQGLFERRFNALYSLTASAKYSFDRMDYLSSWGNSRYDQHETQINTAHKFSVSRQLDLSFSANFTWDRLLSGAYDAERFSPSAVIGASFRTDVVSAGLALEYDGWMDRGGIARNTFSPSADLRVRIPGGFEVTAFARRAFRVPTFNELYYAGYGNPELKPEDAFLSGIGTSFRKAVGNWAISASADGYFNLLTDKIVSAPTMVDPNIWLPYNIGRARSLGADLAAGFNYAKGLWAAGLKVRYGFQSATDRTPGSSSLGQQIPYVAKHTILLDGDVAFRGWKLDASWNFRAGLRDGSGEMPDWDTLDATFSKEFEFKGCGPLTLFLKGLNLLDCRYESVAGYPMPGRSLTGGFILKF